MQALEDVDGEVADSMDEDNIGFDDDWFLLNLGRAQVKEEPPTESVTHMEVQDIMAKRVRKSNTCNNTSVSTELLKPMLIDKPQVRSAAAKWGVDTYSCINVIGLILDNIL